MMDFEKAVAIVLKHEGGYVNDPVDRGGETKYGIAKRSYPNVDIKNLTIEQAKEIYRKDFWIKSKAHLLPSGLNLAVFDYAVNAGVRRALKALQAVVGATPDGIWGPNTVRSINKALVFKGPKLVATELCQERVEFYVSIVLNRNNQIRFLKGWIRRVFHILMEINNG